MQSQVVIQAQHLPIGSDCNQDLFAWGDHQLLWWGVNIASSHGHNVRACMRPSRRVRDANFTAQPCKCLHEAQAARSMMCRPQHDSHRSNVYACIYSQQSSEKCTAHRTATRTTKAAMCMPSYIDAKSSVMHKAQNSSQGNQVHTLTHLSRTVSDAQAAAQQPGQIRMPSQVQAEQSVMPSAQFSNSCCLLTEVSGSNALMPEIPEGCSLRGCITT